VENRPVPRSTRAKTRTKTSPIGSALRTSATSHQPAASLGTGKRAWAAHALQKRAAKAVEQHRGARWSLYLVLSSF
jgi:hypothetical protein